jgi:hypothetical protein
MVKKNVRVVKQDAILQIEVSGAYYNRVYDLMTRLIERQPDPKQALINIDSLETKLSISEATIQTFMMLIKSVEEEANKDIEKNTEMVEIEISEDPA